MWTRFLVASRVDPVVLVSSAGLSFFGWTRPRTRRRKRKYRNWTIYVQKKQRKLAVALCFFFLVKRKRVLFRMFVSLETAGQFS